jgi:hypothetical protein
MCRSSEIPPSPVDKSIPPVQLLHTMHATREELAQRLAEVPIGDPPSVMLRKSHCLSG